MTQRIILICLVILAFSCGEDKNSSYTITGNVIGVADGTVVRLQELVNNSATAIDSFEVTNEKFTFTGVADTAEMHFIAIKNVRGQLPFILENGAINIELDAKNLNKSVLSGTKENDLLNTYTTSLLTVSEKSQALNNAYREAQKNSDSVTMQSVIKSFDSMRDAQTDFELKFVETNNNALMGAMVLERIMHSKGQSAIKVKELYDALPAELKQSRSGKNIDKFLKPMLATAEGAVAPGFEAPNPEGKLIALKDITSKNKVTIVDFWAAWCGPCRKENPNLVRIYDKYHDKGLEIIGVSLDGNQRQPDPKAAWIKAIEDDGLKWEQVSNLKYFRDPIAESYNIRAIPATFVLDQEGKIIGKELRGKALEDKIAELLN